jgi:hypothetical protein
MPARSDTTATPVAHCEKVKRLRAVSASDRSAVLNSMPVRPNPRRLPPAARPARITAASGEPSHFAIDDGLVDNLANSAGGGLQAHDCWNNQSEFVTPLAGLLV